MKKFVCIICGYVHEGDCPPEKCPQCGAPASKFEEQKGEIVWADEHRVGICDGIPEDIIQDLRNNFNGECSEVGMYLAMSRQADREGYPEVAEAYKRIAFEEADHAAKFAELWAKLLQTPPRKIFRCVLMRKAALPQANLILQNVQRQLTLMLYMTPFTKWQRTRQDTAVHSLDCLTDILNNTY